MTFTIPWRPLTFAALGLSIPAYLLGRHQAPTKVVERERVVVKEVQVESKRTEVAVERVS